MDEARWLDHTADVGADLEADDLEALFQAALAALVEVMLAEAPQTPDGERTIRLEAPTAEQLLVRWLEEWVFLVQSTRRVPVESELEITRPAGDDGAWQLEAHVRDATLDPVGHDWQGEVKGVTFHGLRIEHEGERVRAQIVFDV